MSEVLKAIAERSSTRGYSDERLSKEELDALVKAGLQAPTAANRQEIHFSVLDGKNPILKEIEEEMYAGKKPANAAHNFYYEAPTVMILSGDGNFSWSPVDAGIAVENIALAAEGMGLGSLIIGCIKGAMRGEKEAYFAEKLQFPEGYRYEIAVAVGKKAVTKEQHTYSEEKNVSYIG